MINRQLALIIIVFVATLFLHGCSAIEQYLSSELVDKELVEINNLLDQEEYEKSFRDLKVLINNYHVGESDLNVIAVKFLNAEMVEEGLYILNSILLRGAYSDSTHNNLSWAYNILNNKESANFFADKALEIRPNDEYEYINKANALRSMKRYEDALEFYDLALEECPDISQAVWGKGMVYFDLSNYEQSLHYFIKYRELVPDDEESTRYYITSCYTEMGLHQKAIEEYEGFFLQNPTDTSPLYSILFIYYDQQMYDKAIEYTDKILEIDSQDGWAYYNQVDCFAKMNMPEAALAALKKSIELDPGIIYEIFYLDERDAIFSYDGFLDIFNEAFLQTS